MSIALFFDVPVSSLITRSRFVSRVNLKYVDSPIFLSCRNISGQT